MANVFLAPGAERDIRKLDTPVQKSLRREFELLKKNPQLGKRLHGILRGHCSHDFRRPSGEFRIAYEIIRDDVIVLMVGPRENFYQRFERRRR